MRLLNIHDFSFREFYGDSIPPYIITSHRWTDDETTFKDVAKKRNLDCAGWRKIQGFCDRAKQDNELLKTFENATCCEWIWIDTCCIDKRSSAEVSESINSMFQWYSLAQECHAYLADVRTFPASQDPVDVMKDFEKSEWFKRGWTLQELLAPRCVVFFTSAWEIIGHKCAHCYNDALCEGAGPLLNDVIAKITGIPPEVLRKYEYSDSLGVEEKMKWQIGRRTTRPEDRAYCLLGLFGVHIPLLYGEGERAMFRLEQAVTEELQRPWRTQSHLLLPYIDTPYGTQVKRMSSMRRSGRPLMIMRTFDVEGEVSCICGYADDDGWTVACDECARWQHSICYYPEYVDHSLPEDLEHHCIKCLPRKLDHIGARIRQRAKRGETGPIVSCSVRPPFGMAQCARASFAQAQSTKRKRSKDEPNRVDDPSRPIQSQSMADSSGAADMLPPVYLPLWGYDLECSSMSGDISSLGLPPMESDEKATASNDGTKSQSRKAPPKSDLRDPLARGPTTEISAHMLVQDGMRGTVSRTAIEAYTKDTTPDKVQLNNNDEWMRFIDEEQLETSVQGSPRLLPTDADADLTGSSQVCPITTCGRRVKDLKAHMLSHESERPWKCSVTTCEYHIKGFARNYDQNRHILTHYKGTIVCPFCLDVDKTFNRVDVFKRHLTAVHGVEQNPPNVSMQKPGIKQTPFRGRITEERDDGTTFCTICDTPFTTPQNFYNHLDDCVLSAVQPEKPELVTFQCLESSCASAGVGFATKDDLMRHNMMHHNIDRLQLFDCPSPLCDRKGEKGFTRKDRMLEHQQRVHKSVLGRRSRYPGSTPITSYKLSKGANGDD